MLNATPLKLHTKTTIVVSIVLAIVFAVIAYLWDQATTRISDRQEEQEAQLVALRVASSIEHHLKIERRSKLPSRTSEETITPVWDQIEEAIDDTIINNYPELSEVRVFYKSEHNIWQETVRLPTTLGPPSTEAESRAREPLESAKIIDVRRQGSFRYINVVAPVVYVSGERGQEQIATVFAVLAFDSSQSSATEIRGMMWPIVLLAIAAITLSTYFLFRQIVYAPIDNLLAAMSKAQAGNLAVKVEPSASDEIGMLASRFNSMLSRIREMNEQLSSDQRDLESRVREATGEIAERNEQLEEANLRLFEMQRQLTQLERLAAAGQLAAQFAHEVGTPLNLISGHVQLLRARATDERSIKRLDIISSQIDRISNIVKSMLDSTRRPGLRLASVNLNALILQILDATQPTLAARNVELRVEMAEERPHIEADADQLQQVFINLINNSLDAMPEGGMLSVRTLAYDDQAIIELADTGEGIPADQINLIFDPLFSTKGARGTGIGLTVVKQIVVEHGGTVEVESGSERGTVFRIIMPREKTVPATNIQATVQTETSAL
jgi:signal transduction histidine kinase